jgi:tRNA threonylcarbamoyl adenosine modification protein (Sua5/YciO/YrdC/YwlC family)
MSQYFHIHSVNPQQRLIKRCVDVIREGGLIAYPTDSSYALGCHIGDKAAMEGIRRIRRTDKDHDFTLVCRDLTEIALYARVDNWAYRLLKSITPGPYTFILRATREVPRRLQNPKRRSIGIRVPDHPVPQAILEELGEPIMSSTLLLPGDDLPLTDPELIHQRLGNQVEAVVDSGFCGPEPSTVLDLSDGTIEVRRRGKGDINFIAP